MSPLRDLLGSPILEAIRERDSKGGQLGLSLQDLDAGFGAELDHLEVAAAATAAGRPTAAAQVLDLATLEPEQTLRRRRNRTVTITPSGPKLTSITDAPGRRSIRLNAVVARTSSSSASS